MSRDDALAKLTHLRRRCYAPTLEAGDGTATDSKRGGVPYVPPGTSWPTTSGRALPLQVQLNSSQLPEPLRKTFGEGLIQLFADDAGDAHVVRLVEIDGDSIEATGPTVAARTIRGWRVADDHPSAAACARLGVELTDDDREALAAGEPIPRTGEKLSGWPAWSGDAAHPSCPTCGKRMRLVYQLELGGRPGFLLSCASHPLELAFAS